MYMESNKMAKQTGLQIAKGKGLAKFIITGECPRQCPYCLSKHMRLEEDVNLIHVAMKLSELKNKGYTGIMVSGGEPTVSSLFKEKVYLCKAFFPFVAITTGQEGFLETPMAKQFDEVVLSLHCGIMNTPQVPAGMKVFASILDFQYDATIPKKLADLGYAGLTISEDKFGKILFDSGRLPRAGTVKYNDGLTGNARQFSTKLNRRSYCLADRHFLLPDLSITTDYSNFLEENEL